MPDGIRKAGDARPRWSGSRTGRPPVKMAAHAYTSPSVPVGVSRASVGRLPLTKATRRRPSASVGRCATERPAVLDQLALDGVG